MISILTSPITLRGFMQSTVLSVSFVNDIAYVTDADGREQQAHKGFVLPSNIGFEFVVLDRELCLKLCIQDINKCAGNIPEDALNVDHIPGLDRYLKKAGFEVHPKTENCVSLTISNPSKVSFANANELLTKLRGLLEMIGGRFLDDINKAGVGTRQFNNFKNAFDADPTIINIR